MIWITVLLFIFSDAAFNHWRERKGHAINHWWNGLYRVAFGALLVWGYGIYLLQWQQMVFFAISAFFWFWLLFNLILNKFNELPWYYLGTRAILDRIEGTAPAFWMWVKIACAPSFLYFFYVPTPSYG